MRAGYEKDKAHGLQDTPTLFTLIVKVTKTEEDSATSVKWRTIITLYFVISEVFTLLADMGIEYTVQVYPCPKFLRDGLCLVPGWNDLLVYLRYSLLSTCLHKMFPDSLFYCCTIVSKNASCPRTHWSYSNTLEMLLSTRSQLPLKQCSNQCFFVLCIKICAQHMIIHVQKHVYSKKNGCGGF